MGGRRIALVAAATLAVLSGRAGAQTLNPGPPGPFVVDVRGASSGVPSGLDFTPGLTTGATVPTRGFGAGIGGHVYLVRIGPARMGIGADVMVVRGSTADVSSTLTTVAPQLSLNFGTSDGWSYLSAGPGVARYRLDPGLSSSVRSVNFGGGARWFLGPRLGIGFDVRVHKLRAGELTPSATAASVAVGLSLKS
jgi:hypothetical protein